MRMFLFIKIRIQVHTCVHEQQTPLLPCTLRQAFVHMHKDPARAFGVAAARCRAKCH